MASTSVLVSATILLLIGLANARTEYKNDIDVDSNELSNIFGNVNNYGRPNHWGRHNNREDYMDLTPTTNCENNMDLRTTNKYDTINSLLQLVFQSDGQCTFHKDAMCRSLCANRIEPNPCRNNADYKTQRSVESCYKVHTDKKTWYEALEVCKQEGAHLATISNREEKNVLSTIAMAHNIEKHYYLFIGHWKTSQGWVDITNDPNMNPFDFNYWGNNQPESLGEGCSALSADDGTVHDYWCHDKPSGFICEKEL